MTTKGTNTQPAQPSPIQLIGGYRLEKTADTRWYLVTPKDVWVCVHAKDDIISDLAAAMNRLASPEQVPVRSAEVVRAEALQEAAKLLETRYLTGRTDTTMLVVGGQNSGKSVAMANYMAQAVLKDCVKAIRALVPSQHPKADSAA